MTRHVNHRVIVETRRGGIRGHIVRSRSGVKLAVFYGPDSLERAVSEALSLPRADDTA
jgi:hypothetical protein